MAKQQLYTFNIVTSISGTTVDTYSVNHVSVAEAEKSATNYLKGLRAELVKVSE